MRYVIANWKMQLGVAEAVARATELVRELALPENEQLEVVICPSFAALGAVGEVIKASGLKLGAEDVAVAKSGAFTGDVSARELVELGCEYAIVGHSERRMHHGETDGQVRQKIAMLLAEKIVPIVCVGESREERLANITGSVLKAQVAECLRDVTELAAEKIVIAYEPRWAIGTGLAATVEDASAATVAIREALVELLGEAGADADKFPVLYGGSVDVANAVSFATAEGLSGVLVGTASLDTKSLLQIVGSLM